MAGKIRLDHGGIAAILKGGEMQALVREAADAVASNVESQNILVGALAGALAGCGDTADPAETSSPRATGSSPASTDLSAGSVTVTIDGTDHTYQAAYLVDGIDATVSGGTYASTSSDEPVFLVVNGGSLTVTDATVEKSGDAGTNDPQRPGDVSDEYNFFGTNSAVVVIGEGSTASLSDTTITTASSGSNAVVAIDGAIADVQSSRIETSGDSSRGLHATYGGTITGADVDITTAGAHSAAVATDRGGGTVTVDGEGDGDNTFATSGEGSPLIYSTGDIAVSDVTGTADGSEAVVIEGRNTATIADSEVTSSGEHAVMIYQSFSGDAADADAAGSVGSLTVRDTDITFTGSGALAYFTNTTAELALDDVEVDASSGILASAQQDRWGNAGSNGAKAKITVADSTLTGSVEAGPGSSIAVVTTEGGSVTGATSGDVTID